MLDNKTVLVTGGTGSMGEVFVRRALSGEFGEPEHVIVFSRDEAKQYEMRRRHPSAEYILGDIRNYEDVCSVARAADIIVNGAALKQVPSCEYHPHQAVLTNCLGMQNIVRAVSEGNADPQVVVSVSTDKACKPTTAMGMSKALQERIMVAANLHNHRCRFVGVRYGNVLESRGSVIPLFREQIAAGGPVTVTHPEMTRFLLTINQAVDTTFAAIDTAGRGEILVPRAPSARIVDIATEMCAGLHIKILNTGIRPGEKMHEIMVSDEEAAYTIEHDKYYSILPMLPELRTVADSLCERPLNAEYSSREAPILPYALRALLRGNGIIK